jgi:hypothetical protein
MNTAVRLLEWMDQTSQLPASLESDVFDPFHCFRKTLKAEDLTFCEIGTVVDTSFTIG